MAIKVLGGLTIENFSNPEDIDRIRIQQKLYEEKLIEGIQLRVGHDFTNKLPLSELIKKVDDLEIPILIHCPSASLGVDLGETLDWSGKFEEYSLSHPGKEWKSFNLEGISNALLFAQKAKNLLGSRVVLHLGHSLNTVEGKKSSLIKINDILAHFPKDRLSLETVPALVIKDDKITHYEFGGIPEEMESILGKEVYHMGAILLDFTHIGVTSNQMIKWPSMFNKPRNYEKLVEDFLRLGANNFAHFSGETKKTWDAHEGFLGTQDPNKQQVVINALKELNKRYSAEQKDVYVAIEIRFDELEKSRKEIEAFRSQYIK